MELRNGVPQNTITLIVKFALWCTKGPKINKRYAWNNTVMVYP